MAKKIKVTKKKIPFLKTDLVLDPAVVTKLTAVQNKFKTRFKTQIESAQKEASGRFNEKIDSLTKAKAKMLKEYNAEIKKYKALANNMKAMTKETKSIGVSQKKPTTNKASIKKAPSRKK